MKKLTIFALGAFLALFLFVSAHPVTAFDSPAPTDVPTLPEPTLPPPPTGDEIELVFILTWILSGGCGWLTFKYLENYPPDWFTNATPKRKQLFASALSAGLALLAYLALVGLEVEPLPGDFVEWFNAVAPVLVFGATVAKFSHAQATLGEGE